MSENMIFCTNNNNEGYQKNNRIFNQDVTHNEFLEIKNNLNINIELIVWIDNKLKIWTYKEAWANWWGQASQEQKDSILHIKQFDAEIFKDITGIDVNKKTDEIKITVEGKDIMISRKSAKALNLI